MKLYEINNELRNALENSTRISDDEIMNEDGEIFTTEDIEKLMIAREEKIEGIAVYVKELLAEEEALKKESDNISKRRKSLKNKAESLKNYLDSMMMGEKFSSPKATISWRKSASLLVEDTAIVPENYLKYKAPDIDKEGLKKAIKNGESFDGIYVIEKQNIQIK